MTISDLIKQAPELRFSEFTDGWQIKKLGQLTSITTGKLDANAMVENGCYRFYTCAKEYFAINDYAFDTEALLISGNGANVGYVHYYKGRFNAYQRTYVLDNFNVNIFYVKQYLDKHLKRRIFAEKFEGNTPYIVLGTLTNMPIGLPEAAEQQKIADFLTGVDERIAGLEKKVELLQRYKKGAMQQIFSQKRRFTHPDSSPFPDWEEKRLEEIFSIHTGSSKSVHIDATGSNFIVDMGAISQDAKLLKTKRTNLTHDYLSTSDLVMAKDDIGGGNIIGKVVLIPQDDKYVLGDHVYRLSIKDGAIKYFYYAINSPKVNRSFRNKANGTAQIGINNKTVSDQPLPVPSLEEQQKIADFLSALDQKITLTQKQLKHAQQFKKALVQRMFV